MDFPIYWQTYHLGIDYYIGCGNSHRLCWREIAKEGNEDGWYMVFESDVMLDFDNAAKLGHVNDFFNKHVPEDADIVAVGNLVDLTVKNKVCMYLLCTHIHVIISMYLCIQSAGTVYKVFYCVPIFSYPPSLILVRTFTYIVGAV